MMPQTRLDRFEHRTEWPLAAVAMAFLGLYSVQVLAAPDGRGGVVLAATLASLYFVFIADYLARLYLADPRGQWFVRHLFDLVIVVMPFLRPLRLLSLVVVITALQRAVGHTIRGKVIVYTICGTVLIVYAASLAIIDVEGDHPDANIASFGDAVWWSITTVTTGYNDLTPAHRRGPGDRRGADDRWYQPDRHRHRDAGLLDSATGRRRGHRQSGRDGRTDQRASRRDPPTDPTGRRVHLW